MTGIPALAFFAAAGYGGPATGQSGFTLSSDAFSDGQAIPAKYAHQGIEGGKNISLSFKWNGVPAGTKSFALSIVDPHPVAKNWIHWMIVNIPSGAASLPEGASEKSMPRGAMELKNSYGEKGYGGPEPPGGSGKHPYVVTLYALNIDSLNLKEKTSLKDFQDALSGNVIGSATMTGTFEQK